MICASNYFAGSGRVWAWTNRLIYNSESVSRNFRRCLSFLNVIQSCVWLIKENKETSRHKSNLPKVAKKILQFFLEPFKIYGQSWIKMLITSTFIG